MDSRALGRTLAVALVAAAVGAGLSHYLSDRNSESGAVQPPIETAAKPGATDQAVPEEIRLPIRVGPVMSAAQSVFDNLGSQTVLTLLELPTDFLQTAALYALVGRSDVVAIKGHIEDAYRIPKSGDRTAALTIIYLRFSEIDPEGALAYLYESGHSDRGSILFGMFNGWAKYDLDGALKRFSMLKGSNDQQIASRAIMQAYSDASPDEQQRIAARLPGRRNALEGSASAALAQARADPVGALAAASAISDANTRMQTMGRIADIWARSDPVAALAYSNSIVGAQERQRYRFMVLNSLARNNPEMAFEWLASLTDQQERQAIVSTALSTLAGSNPQRAFALAQNLDELQLRQRAMGTVLLAWANNDVRSAAAAIENIEDRQIWGRFGHAIAQQYAQQAPLEALAWAERVDGISGRMWQTMMSAIAQNDAMMALNLLIDMEPSPQRSETLASVLGTVAARDPWLAIDYLEDLPAGQFRDNAISHIVQQWAQTDPAAAVDWLLTQPDRVQSSSLHSIAYMLARQDLELAASYAELFAGQAQQSWISAVLNNYVEHDLDGALSWLSDYDDHPSYGDWLANVASNVAARDPRAALGIIAGITNPDHLRTAQQMVLSTWASRSPSEAAAWLMSLPGDQRDPSMISSVADTWFRYDPSGAQAWVLSLDSAAERDTGILSLIHHDSLSAESFRSLIGQMSTQEQALHAWQSHIHNLARADPAAAIALIEDSGLSAAQRAELEQIVSQYNGG